MSTVTELQTTIGRTTNNGPSVTRTWHCGQHTIRARVYHDTYRRQSYALAEVLTPALTWATICTIPPEEFHFLPIDPRANKVDRYPGEDDLLCLADELMRRSCAVLRIPATDRPVITYAYIDAEQFGEFYERVLAGAVGVPTDDDGREIHVELSNQDT